MGSIQYYCAACNSCQGCDHCQNTCDTAQRFCPSAQTYASHLGNFSWSQCVAKDEMIGPGHFDQTAWDSIISYINAARAVGKIPTGGYISTSSKEDVNPFSAKEFNRVSNSVGGHTVQPLDLIYGSYFTDLANYTSNCLISYDACDKCNTACDDGCNACEGCEGSKQMSVGASCCGCMTGCEVSAQKTEDS